MKTPSSALAEGQSTQKVVKHILLVDDEAGILELLRDLLEAMADDHRQEWRFTLCESGDAALKEIQSRSFDLIVTDLNMPRVKGDEIIRAKIEDESAKANRQTPVILMTGYYEKTKYDDNAKVHLMGKPLDWALFSQLTEVSLGLNSTAA